MLPVGSNNSSLASKILGLTQNWLRTRGFSLKKKIRKRPRKAKRGMESLGDMQIKTGGPSSGMTRNPTVIN
jgi:hypothetical protein